MLDSIKYYKVLGGQGYSPSTKFDYTSYLPTSDSAGDWLPEIKSPQMLADGYYISQYWNMWYSKGARVYEVDFRFKADDKIYAVEHQICCGQIRLLRDVTDIVIKQLVDNNFNTGTLNTGEQNIGNANTGQRNLGNRNTGKLNSGDFNTGDNNTGIDNVGNCNIGSGNVGSFNKGHSNTGDNNFGSYNSGSFNTGNANTGKFNIGNRNSGRYNVGNYHTGYFNNRQTQFTMFNKPTDIDPSKIILPNWLNKPNLKEAFESATIEELQKTINLPNFDYEIFEEITSISKDDFKRKINL